MSLQVFATRIVPDLTATRNGLFRAIVPVGSIVKVLIVNGAINGAGVTSFDIKLDGVTIGQVIQIAAGFRTSLVSIPKGTVLTTEAQEMSVDLTAVPAGGLHGPLWIQVVVDDALTASKWTDDLYLGATGVHATGPQIAAGVLALSAAQSPLALRIAALTLADTVFNSAAHTSLAHNESTYVYDLYKAILGPDRDGDVPGHDFWYDQFVSQGGTLTRATMREAFVYSTESINNRLNQMFAGSLPAGDAKYLNGVKMKDSVGPSDGQVWAFIAANSQYELVTVSGGGGSPTRGQLVHTTAALVTGTDETGFVAVGKSGMLIRVSSDRASRVRLYSSSALRDADHARIQGGARSGPQDGLMCEVVFTAGLLSVGTQDPVVFYYNAEGPVVDKLYYIISNDSGATNTVQTTFDYVPMES